MTGLAPKDPAVLPEDSPPLAHVRLRSRPVPIRMQRPFLAFDLRESGVWWLRFVAGRKGPIIEDFGTELGSAEDPVALACTVAHRRPNRGARVVTVMRCAEMHHRRIDLPPMTTREADIVMRRRSAELVRELGGELAAGLLGSGAGGPRWICVAPRDLCEDMSHRFHAGGIDLAALGSRQLALGCLARGLARPSDGALTAFVDFGAESVTCAVADGIGLLFGREISLKFAGERLVQADEAEMPGDEPHAAALAQVERVATELRRTFDYVQRQRGLGVVGRAILTGASDELSTLATMLGMYLDLPLGVLGEEVGDGPLAGVAPGSAAAWGLALSPDAAGGNLLPATVYRLSRERTARRRVLLAAGTAGVLGTSLGLSFYENLDHLRSRAAELERRWEQAAEELTAVETAKSTRERVSANREALMPIDRPEPALAALVQALGRAAPSDLFVDAVTMRVEGDVWRFAIEVVAVSPDVTAAAQSISALVQAFAGSPLLTVDTTIQQENAADENSGKLQEGLRYRLEGRLAPVMRAVQIAPSAERTKDSPTPATAPGDARG